MLEVDVDGDKFRVTFFHDRGKRHEYLDVEEGKDGRKVTTFPEGVTDASGRSRRGFTNCVIEKCNGGEAEDEVIAFGVSWCSWSDQFNRRKGRMNSLTMATSELDQKGLRTAIWNEYRRITHGRG